MDKHNNSQQSQSQVTPMAIPMMQESRMESLVRMANQRPKTQAEQQRNKNFGCRCITVDEVRAVEGKDRTFIVSFSSEEPYERWFGMEILDHTPGAIDLERLNSIGVLLFNHDVNKVCGKIIRAWIENARGYAEVEFDTDEFAELIYQKVKSGTLKATSVRYSVDAWEEVAAGKTSSTGKYTGPCSVAVKWMPLEVSIVSVPADATVGVGRSYESEETSVEEKTLSIDECFLKINENS